MNYNSEQYLRTAKICICIIRVNIEHQPENIRVEYNIIIFVEKLNYVFYCSKITFLFVRLFQINSKKYLSFSKICVNLF